MIGEEEARYTREDDEELAARPQPWSLGREPGEGAVQKALG